MGSEILLDGQRVVPKMAAAIHEQKRGARFFAAFGSLMTINLMAALDASIIAVALPTMTRELNGTSIESFWAGTSFLLCSTAFLPVFSSLSHIFGRREVLLAALVSFTIGSVVAGCANKFSLVLIGRCFQGAGGGGVQGLSTIILTDLFPLRERGKWAGLINMMWAVGSVAGPPIGGALSQHASWRWVFWINLPFCGLGLLTVFCFLRLERPSDNVATKLRQVDWLGTVLFPAAMASFLVPLSWGGVLYEWQSWRTLVPLILGFFGLVVFLYHEKKVVKCPLVRVGVFSTPTAAIAYFGTLIQGMTLWTLLYYLPYYYQGIKDMSATMTGVAFLPSTFTLGPISIVVGTLIGKIGRYKWGVLLGWALSTLGMGLTILLDIDTPVVGWVLISIVSGIGIGSLFSSLFFAVQAGAARVEDLAHSAAMSAFSRNFGQALGVAVGGAIFQNQLHQNLQATSLTADADAYSKNVSLLVESILALASASSTKQVLMSVFISSLRTVWIVFCAINGGVLLLSLFIKDLSLDREFHPAQELKLGQESQTDPETQSNKESRLTSIDTATMVRSNSDASTCVEAKSLYALQNKSQT